MQPSLAILVGLACVFRLVPYHHTPHLCRVVLALLQYTVSFCDSFAYYFYYVKYIRLDFWREFVPAIESLLDEQADLAY